MLATPLRTQVEFRSELDGDARVQRILAARARRKGRAGQAGVLVEAEFVPPQAVSHPDVDIVGVLRTPDRLAGVEGQADRLAVDFHLRRGAGDLAVLAAL